MASEKARARVRARARARARVRVRDVGRKATVIITTLLYQLH